MGSPLFELGGREGRADREERLIGGVTRSTRGDEPGEDANRGTRCGGGVVARQDEKAKSRGKEGSGRARRGRGGRRLEAGAQKRKRRDRDGRARRRRADDAP